RAGAAANARKRGTKAHIRFHPAHSGCGWEYCDATAPPAVANSIDSGQGGRREGRPYTDSWILHGEPRDRESRPGIDPLAGHPEAGGGALGRHNLGCVFVGALGPDVIAFGEGDLQARCADDSPLPAPADEVHLDSRFGAVPDGPMAEPVNVERAAEL